MKRKQKLMSFLFRNVHLISQQIKWLSMKKVDRFTILQIIFAKNRKSREFNFIQMFEQIITHFVSSFTECIWIKTFLYSITFVVLSTFCLSLLQVHFSATMLHLFLKLWWKKTIIGKSLNWIITLLWNYYKKAEEKLIVELKRKWEWNNL